MYIFLCFSLFFFKCHLVLASFDFWGLFFVLLTKESFQFDRMRGRIDQYFRNFPCVTFAICLTRTPCSLFSSHFNCGLISQTSKKARTSFIRAYGRKGRTPVFFKVLRDGTTSLYRNFASGNTERSKITKRVSLGG